MPTKADTIVITDDNISEMPISFSRDILSALNAQYNNPTANYGTLKATFYPVYIFILKFIAPIGIALIFMNELGLLG